jgi:hypothetical protein
MGYIYDHQYEDNETATIKKAQHYLGNRQAKK